MLNSLHALRASVILIACLVAGVAVAATPGVSHRRVYNPVTGQSELASHRPQLRVANPPRPEQSPAAQQRKEAVEPASFYDDRACGEDCLGCSDLVCGDTCGPCPPQAAFYTGFEATLVKPRFEDNVAFTVMEADGATFESFTDTEFDYDLEFTPRVFLGWRHGDGVGLRATWWQFDHAAAAAIANPPANGFGSITHPAFGAVDISSNIPTDVFSAASDLNAYTLDLEATKETTFCGWNLGVAGGVRYAYSEQSYLAELRNNANTLRGQINFRQSIEGFGPTVSLAASRPFHQDIDVFVRGRASVLFGDGESTLTAVEDADLATPFNTSRTTNRDDLLSIGEVQVGFRWQAAKRRGRAYTPFLSAALEGQIWDGAGNATSEEGSIGFFGFSLGIGANW